MLFKTVSLSVAVLATATIAIPAPDAKSWSFSVYQGDSCTQGPPLNISGSGTEACSPPPEYNFASVIVHSDASGACSVGFYAGDSGTACTGKVAAAPGKITVGKCYTFPAANVPATYAVTC